MNEIIEKNESSDLDSEEDYDESAIVAIITLWDDEIGPKIVDAYPKTNLKLDKISLQIFMMYQLFLDDPNKPFQDTSMTIPLKLIDRKCRFQFNSFPNENIRGGFQPFTISLIFPDYYSNKQIEQFNEIILKISQEFKRDQSIKLESFYDNIKNLIKFELIEAEKEDIIIDDNYSYTAAIEDFQAGVNLYRTKNYEKALEKIKKVLLKFRMEKNDHLVMEALNLIASIFSQQKFFNKASKYFKELVELAESLQQEKYLEIGTFMLAYCYYKVEDYRRSFEIFKKIDVNNIKYINKLQFFTIYGRVCEKLGDYNNAIEFLLEANDIGETLQKNKLTLSQLSLILYDIGFIYFKKAGRIIKDFGINNIKRYEKDLNNSLNYFKLSSKYLMQLNDKAQLSIIYQNIGNIYDILENEKEFIKYYKNALEILAEQKTLTQNVTILERMVQKMHL